MRRTETAREQKGKSRYRFSAMAATYFLGVFNDNFFKQAAMLLAISAGMSSLQGTAAMLFSLPFILCSAYAGWMADRFEKRYVIIGAKWLELAAMIIGAMGIIYMNWTWMIAMVCLMGLQSTLFGPSLNGTIPEVFQPADVPGINARLKLATTAAILLGIACAGIVLDLQRPGTSIPFGRTMVAAVVLMIAVGGVIASFWIPGRAAAVSDIRFPWSGPVNSIKDFWRCRKDAELLKALYCSTFFYFVSSLAVLVINTLGLKQLALSQTQTSLLAVSLMVGVCFGSFAAARLMHMRTWSSLLPLSAAGMGAGLLLTAGVPFLNPAFSRQAAYIFLMMAGIFGGLFLIPITSFIQLRPEAAEKGRVIAVSNFLDFTGILVAGELFIWLDKFFLPSQSIGILGIFSFGCAMTLLIAQNKKNMVIGLLGLCLRLRYAIRLKNFDSVRKAGAKGILFLPNHPALIDPVMMMAVLGKRFDIRPLADKNQIEQPVVRSFMRLFNPIVLPDLETSGRQHRAQVELAINEVNAALANGDNVLFYPGGRIYRGKNEDLRANSGVEQILKTHPDIQIVMVAIHGLWGSSFSRAGGVIPKPFRLARKYILSLLANGIFFGPRRKVAIEFKSPSDFPRHSDRHTINRYLEQFYNKDMQPNTKVPYTWFERGGPVVMPEPAAQTEEDDTITVDEHIQREVIDYLEDLTGLSQIDINDKLARDLGLDSLSVVEIMVWVETAFGVVLHDPERLVSVRSVMLAASGMLIDDGQAELKTVAAGWYHDPLAADIRIPEGGTIPEVFLAQAARNPDRVVIADQIVGTKTYRDVLAGIMALKPHVETIPGDKVGVMFPASASATIVILAVMFSGKVPVLVNWTIGEGALAYTLQHAGVTHVITSSALIKRLENQGFNYGSVTVEMLFIEEIVQKITVGQKMRAYLGSRMFWKKLLKAPIADTAAILFTSGTEARPKAVPLSHENFLVNIRDYVSVFTLKENNRLLSMLPPFHSFGLSTGTFLPLLSGVKTVYHANPNEGAMLAALIHAYKTTLIFGTPTFVHGIMRSATSNQMNSLALIVTGAEKCSESVFRMVAEKCPNAVLCEGYGITECSPVVSVNRMEHASRGGIGPVLPSVEYRIVHSETFKPLKNGEQGLLLLRGPSIFNGYLGPHTPSPFVILEGKKWYNTGDLVKAEDDGYLTFCGRLKRFIKRGGEMISLNAIEAALDRHFSDFAGDGPNFAVLATDSEENPEIVLFTAIDLSRETVNEAIRRQGLSGLYYVRKVIRVSEIPLLGTGKTDYRSLKVGGALN